MEQYLHYIGGGAGALALTGVAAASAYYLTSRPTPERPLFPLDAQCIFEQEGPDVIRVSRFFKEAKEGKFISYIYPDAKTLYETFRRGSKVSTLPVAELQRGSTSRSQFRQRSCGHWFTPWYNHHAGHLCPELPRMDPFRTGGVLLQHAEITTVVCEDDAKCNMLLEKSPRCLKKMIVIKDIRPATRQRAKNRGVEVIKFTDVEVLGAKSNHPEVRYNGEPQGRDADP
nr:unnamed protein product [Callosobruchus chinensis]